MSYKTPQPLVTAFSDPNQQNVVRRMGERLDGIEEAINLQSLSSGRKAPAPPQAQLNVTSNPNVPGHFFVRITNPEFLGTNRNRVTAPIRHLLQASPNVSFNANVTTFPVSHQTYFPVSELGKGTFHFQLTSTFDGKTFNAPVRSGPVTA